MAARVRGFCVRAWRARRPAAAAAASVAEAFAITSPMICSSEAVGPSKALELAAGDDVEAQVEILPVERLPALVVGAHRLVGALGVAVADRLVERPGGTAPRPRSTFGSLWLRSMSSKTRGGDRLEGRLDHRVVRHARDEGVQRDVPARAVEDALDGADLLDGVAERGDLRIGRALRGEARGGGLDDRGPRSGGAA